MSRPGRGDPANRPGERCADAPAMADGRTRGGQEIPTTERQREGYDEAARGGRGVPPSDVGVPPNPGDERDSEQGDERGADDRVTS